MGKGNFFKKNIKKRKKERKERSIKQRILEQKKKVEEKLHHVVEVVTEIEKSPEPVVEKPEVKPERVVSESVVLDTNVIIDSWNGKYVDAMHQLLKKPNVKIMLTDTALGESSRKLGSDKNTIFEFVKKTFGDYRVEKIETDQLILDHASEMEKKYPEKLHRPDSIIFGVAKMYDADLITNDNAIKECCAEEKINAFDHRLVKVVEVKKTVTPRPSSPKKTFYDKDEKEISADEYARLKEVEESPEPVVEKPVEETKVNYLIFDESIISYIMLDNRQVIEGIQKFSEKEIKFLTFDAVINFFIENERVTFNRILTFDQVVNKLKQIGDFQYYGFDEDSAVGQRANALFEAEKYIDDSDILEEKKLSKTDCILIELLIDKSVILVTNNALLKKATTQEAKERNVTVKIFDPLEL